MLKKGIIILLVSAVVCSFAGCDASQDIKGKIIVEGLGIDYDGRRFTVTALFYSPQDPDSSSEIKSESMSVDSETLSEAFSKISKSIGKMPFYANNRIVILGEGAYGNKLYEIIDYIVRDSGMREDSYLLSAENASEILKNEKLAKSDNNYIFTLLRVSAENGNCVAMTASKASVCSLYSLGDIFMPRIYKNEEDIAIGGTLLFSGKTPALLLNEKQSLYLSVVRDEISRPVVSTDTESGKAGVKFLQVSGKITSQKNQPMKFIVKIDLKCSVSERQNPGISESQISAALQRQFEDGISQILDETLKKRVDAANILKTVRQDNFEYFKAQGGRIADMLSSAEFELSVKAQIMRTGRKKG